MTADAPASAARVAEPATTAASPWGVLRDHWLFALLVVAGVVMRVLAVLAYRPALLFDDSVAYLRLAEVLVPGEVRPLGFPLLLRPVLAVGDLDLVPFVQHGMGLATAGIVYATLLRLGVRRWLAALGVGPLLVDAYVVQIEQMVMPEPLFHLLIAVGLAVLVWRRPPPWWALATGGLLLAAAVTVRLVGQILIVPLVAYALLAAGPGLRRRLLAAAVAVVAFLLPLGGYASWYRAEHGELRLSDQSDVTWYGRVAPFIDCEVADVPPEAEPLCPRLPVAQRPGPGMYVHSARSPLADYEPPPGVDRGEVLRAFAREAILAQPLTYAGQVASDFTWVFSWAKVNKPDSPAPVERWHFPLAYPDFVPNAAEVTARYDSGPPRVVVGLARVLRGYQLGGGFVRGPFLLAGLVAGLLGAVGVGRARRSGLRAVCLLFTLVPAALLLVPAAIFEFSWRYQLPGIVFYPVAGVLGLTALTGFVGREVEQAPAGAPPREPPD